jgi:hypothetical protein
MSEYPQYPTDPNQPPTGPTYGTSGTRGSRPPSATLAVRLLWGAIALFVLGAVLTFGSGGSVIGDEMVRAGATPEQADAATATVMVIGGVIVVVLGGLFALLTVFIAKGANWARIVTTVLAAIGVLFTLPSLFGLGSQDQPVVSTVVSLLQLALVVAAVVLLYRPDAHRWFSAR